MTNEANEMLSVLLDRIGVDTEGRLEAVSRSSHPHQPPKRGPLTRIVIVGSALLVTATLVSLLVFAFDHLSTRTAQPPACTWRVVPAPHVGPPTFDDSLRAVTMLSATEAWAVGVSYYPGEGGPSHPLIMRWDGGAWTETKPPVGADAELMGISASSPDDVWAVGNIRQAGLLLHWDGSRWTRMDLVDPGTRFWHLSDVEAVSPMDVWVVGSTATGHSGGPLVEHWDGTEWSIVPSEGVPVSPLTGLPYAGLQGVSSDGSGSIWAVGEATNVPQGASNTLVERGGTDGLVAVATPNKANSRGIPFDHLFDVAASLGQAWAVGSWGDQEGTGGGGDHALALRWDGHEWSSGRLPPLGRVSRLSGITTLPGGGAVAVGSSGVSGTYGAVILRWDDGRWITDGPHLPGTSLASVASGPDGSMVAVGDTWHQASGAESQSLLCD